jgi:hypothetical protein
MLENSRLKDNVMTKKKKPDLEDGWSTGAKVGAAVGSAALMAALLYAGKRHLSTRKGKLEPESPEPKALLPKAKASVKAKAKTPAGEPKPETD